MKGKIKMTFKKASILWIILLFIPNAKPMGFVKKIYLQFNKDNFFEAVKKAEKNKIEEFLKLGIDINSFDKNQNTALEIACLSGNLEIVDLLIKNGANVNLHGTKTIDFSDLLKDSKSKIYFKPINYAIKSLNPDIVELLLKNNAKITIEEFGQIFFYFIEPILIFYNEYPWIHKNLRANGISFNVKNEFISKSNSREAEISEKLLNNLTKILNLFLDKLIEENKFKDFINKTLNIEKIDPTIVHMNIWCFLSANFGFSTGYKPCEYKIIQKNKYAYGDILENMLIEKIYFIFNKIVESIKKNNYKNFKFYLFALGTVNCTDINGNNLLHHAIREGNLEFVKLLCHLNSDLLWKENKDGQNPICFMHNTNIISWIKNKALELENKPNFIDIIRKSNQDAIAQNPQDFIVFCETLNYLMKISLITSKIHVNIEEDNDSDTIKNIFRILIENKNRIKKDIFGDKNKLRNCLFNIFLTGIPSIIDHKKYIKFIEKCNRSYEISFINLDNIDTLIKK